MIAIVLVAIMMIVGLLIGCMAVGIHFDEQERRLKQKNHLNKILRDWYAQRGAARRHFARSGQSAQREPHGHRHVAVLYRFR